MKSSILILPFLFLLACADSDRQSADQRSEQDTGEKVESTATIQTIGRIERLDPRLDALIPKKAKIEVLASGFDWAEGPLWLPSQQMLIFSDVPQNRIFGWSEKKGLHTYLQPSGFTGDSTNSREPGSNGLALDRQDRLLLCQHGNRQVAQMDAPLDAPQPKYTTIADRWKGKRFNSPNDLVVDAAGNIFFTDPPYGLAKLAEDPSKEIPFQGVYYWSKVENTVRLLTEELSRPNGITLSSDEKTLYVANSDSKRLLWMAFDNDQGKVSNGRVFFDGMELSKKDSGSADGMKVDQQGNLWATGPGGVLVFSPEGAHLGTIRTENATANCAFNADYSALYMTADSLLLRVQL